MTRDIFVGGLGLVALVAVTGCERTPVEPGNIPGGAETGMLRVLLGSETPASALDPRVTEVWVRIDSVEARHDSEGWITVSDERQDFDLLAGAGGMDDGGGADAGGGRLPGEPPGGPRALGEEPGDVVDPLMDLYDTIGEADVWIGTYDKLHLGIVDAWLVVDGMQQDLEFIGDIDPLDPFDTGLTINESFFVDMGSTTTAQIRWNLGQNLSEKENGRWMLGAQTQFFVDIEEGPGGIAENPAGGGGGGGGNY